MSDKKKWEADDQWVEIDLDLCTGSGPCAESCPAEVYVVENGKVGADAIEDCIQCGACQGVCPNNAILGHWAWT